ncbi:MAG: RDD family protein [Pyrinomonadaceae bacterium]
MQCPACRAVYSNGLDLCPRCQTPAQKSSAEPDIAETKEAARTIDDAREQSILTVELDDKSSAINASATESGAPVSREAAAKTNEAAASTLIEFPGAARASRPQWRKDLSERVREIQERRAREAPREDRARATHTIPTQATPPQNSTQASTVPDIAAAQLGLVPPVDAPAVNPIVVAALRRIERARQATPPPAATRARATSMSGAATAVARVAEEQYEHAPELKNSPPQALPPPSTHATAAATVQAESTTETVKTPELQTKTHNLVVVPAHSIPQESVPKTPPRRIVPEVADEAATPGRLDAQAIEEMHAAAFPENDRAPLSPRLIAGIVDLLVVAFASTPFAAIIELTNGNWTDIRVGAAMGGIIVLVMFLYLTASTALAGRTWGMSLFSMHAVDVHTGLWPTTRQAITRAIAYMLSLAACGLGLAYALMDAEGRAVHDLLSGTIVVRD